jgi:hypothetical protein
MFINDLISVSFRMILYTLISLNYYNLVYLTWLPDCNHSNLACFIVLIYSFMTFMLMWCIIITNTTNPGTIPLYWGFYIGDAENKKKRYCLMCNVFKPERCHHCSVCNVCVLNMDHHCPWLNNCIGFFNRKFFIQMLFYLVLCVLFILCLNAKTAYNISRKVVYSSVKVNKDFSSDLGYLMLFFIDLVAGIILISFFKFHLKIVLDNKTTIETIDHKGSTFNSEVFIQT